MSRAARVLLLAGACAVGVAGLAAGERSHRVASGESASAIAKRYYGDFDLAPLLLAYNGRQGTVVRVGESLRIPACPEHVVRAGDTWSALTQRYLGRPDAWKVVARLNGVPPQQALRVGQSLVFPVVLRHELRRGETLAVLAERYYGNPRQGDVLLEFNSIDDPRRLAVGQSVEVPLVVFRLESGSTTRASRDKKEPEAAGVARATPPQPEAARVARTVPPEAEATLKAEPEPPVTLPAPAAAVSQPEPTTPTPPAPEPEPARRFAEPLREAAVALAQGRFEDGRERLAALREPVSEQGTAQDRAELWRLLVALHVAYDDDELACAAWRSLTELSIEGAADPDLVSPKIREAIERCAVR